MKLSNSIKQPTQSFASVLLACGLFGFLFPHHADMADGRHHMNFIQKNEVQQNDDDSWYAPPRSPGFHEDFGS
jgi:hypothetical protein